MEQISRKTITWRCAQTTLFSCPATLTTNLKTTCNFLVFVWLYPLVRVQLNTQITNWWRQYNTGTCNHNCCSGQQMTTMSTRIPKKVSFQWIYRYAIRLIGLVLDLAQTGWVDHTNRQRIPIVYNSDADEIWTVIQSCSIYRQLPILV